jgi:L-2-hydroxyglutarate oxidase LhgO
MDKAESIVIGAGVVGLAVAQNLAEHGREPLVLERHEGFGKETSSRNSEAIHAGMYYPAASLKATLCVEGNPLLYSWCERHHVRCERVGKLIVATKQEERAEVERLYQQGLQNGVEGLRLITRDQARSLEPNIECVAALHSENTGILDTHELMKSLETDLEENKGIVAYNCDVVRIEKRPDGYIVTVKEGGGELTRIESPLVINAAGLASDLMASLAGIDVEQAGYRLSYCKGEYFSIDNRHRNSVRHLVYPVPTDVSLGIHLVLKLDGTLRLGPSEEYVETIDYSVDDARRPMFADAVRRYMPSVTLADLCPDMSGIRPKLQGPTDAFRDFVIREESARGLPGFVNLIGLESPALTSCLAIGRFVGELT